MKEFKHVIADPMGMHARPAGMLVKAVAPYASKITVTAPTGTADAKRLMALMRLAAIQAAGLPIITPVLVCNTDDYTTFETFEGKDVTNDDIVISVAK